MNIPTIAYVQFMDVKIYQILERSNRIFNKCAIISKSVRSFHSFSSYETYQAVGETRFLRN